MAVNILNTSTLSEALTKDTNNFTVASTSNITVGNYLVIQGTGGIEAVKVQEIPVSGRVKVLRGQGGTRARPCPSGARFFIGNPADFQSLKDGIVAGISGDPGNFNDYLLPGSRYTDGIGNIYQLCELTATTYGGTTCLISTDGLFTARALHGSTDQGPVGLCVDPGTSDQYVWLQIYGYNGYAQSKSATTGVTTADHYPTATTTVSTPDVGLEPVTYTTTGVYLIYGMFVAGAGSSAVTSATSSTGYAVPVFLNFPYVYNRLDSFDVSNS